MTIYQIEEGSLSLVPITSFEKEQFYERKNLQKILREHIDVLDPNLLVIAEEFGDWIDSGRRIDLLCLDRSANLVVVELKRTEDGGHMELQAIRYAAMVSAMTFDQMVDTYSRFTNRSEPDAVRAELLAHLGWDEVDEGDFPNDIRIVLAAADFGKELTTSAMWLNERSIDVRCIRLRPHRLPDGRLLLDVQQLIPLPEAADFQTQLGQKKQAERRSRDERRDLRYRFWEVLLPYASKRTDLHAGRKPCSDSWISGGIGRTGFALNYAIRKFDSQVELWISLGAGKSDANRAAFAALLAQRDKIEAEFGGSLEWQDLPGRDGRRIRNVYEGGYRSPVEEWPAIQEKLVTAMINLDNAFRTRVASLTF